MKRRTRILTAVCLLAVAGAWFFWPHGRLTTAAPRSGGGVASTAAAVKNSTVSVAKNSAAVSSPKPATLNTNKLAYRLSNTTNSLLQLQSNPHAILMENALIDTEKPLNLKIPAHLRAASDPGAYIVQARGPTDVRFRAMLQSAGAEIVSYIPNNAYLVRMPGTGTAALAADSQVQSVLPYEPYYKIQSSLLGLAVNQQELPPGTALALGVFAGDQTAEQEIENLGAKIIGHDQSPFGPVLRVLAPPDWTTLVQSPAVQFVEPLYARKAANDLSRVTVGISPDTISSITNDWMGLTGSNVLVSVNDSGIDRKHPDFSATGTAAAGPSGPTRVFNLNPFNLIDLVDTNGHGTHVAGIIAGNGSESLGLPGPLGSGPNVGAFAEGSVSNADFRGKAPLATLFSLAVLNNEGGGNGISDYAIQSESSLSGALISNNSWAYGDEDYDLAAASYDAATRDALPYVTGSQPVLFVFAAGNSGGGLDDGTQGSADTIQSPATAKNAVTVGALEQFRNITNLVTIVTPGTGTNPPTTNMVEFWQPGTDSANQVASYSSRGNVGIGTEGAFGRFKPDLVSPGTFVVSTRSSQWDTNAYFNLTNVLESDYLDQIVGTNTLSYYTVAVPPNAVAVTITLFTNNLSPVPFPTNLPIYARQATFPTTTNYDIVDTNSLDIPPDNGGAISGIQAIQGNGFSFAVGNTNNFPVNYNLVVDVLVTNENGNEFQVLEGMDEQLAPYYRYETGTSMAAADVSGVLALIQDYFTNTLKLTPSPALMKALLINGCRSTGDYTLSVTNGINFEGWGLDNIQNCVPMGGLTSQFNTPSSSFFVDQNPTNALATGDSHTFIITLDPTTFSPFLPLQATLVWTDPPGDPAAAIKLVNNLDLIITNLDTGDVNYGSVYFGNDISPDTGFNEPWDTNGPPNLDTINNVENILLQPELGTKYSVTVLGRAVNVNAVTAQTNNAAGQFAPNVVQDYALVISVGDAVNFGQVSNAFTVVDAGLATNPVADQDITFVTTTNTPLFNQMAGASSPLMGTNTLPLGTNTIWGPNGLVTIGETNQWHFYVITNTGQTSDFTNAAFITFDVNTLSIPRMGTLDPLGLPDATRPEADIDLFVSQDPSITNLNPVALSNALAGTSIGGVGDGGTALTQGGTEYVFFTNSSPGQVYYVGVQSEDREGAEYSFLPVFTDIPFSSLDQNGNQIVHGLLLPVYVPDGNNAHPGVTNVFALAIMPMEVEKVTVTNLDEHQNFGDLFGQLTFSGQRVVLNNHDGFGNTFGHAPIVYDDSRDRPLGTTNTDGPGSLLNYRGLSALGPWILGELDNSPGATGQVSRLDLVIQPHRDLKEPGIIVVVPPQGWFIDYVDVPAGYTNLTFAATNLSDPLPAPIPAMQMYEKFGEEPTLTDFDFEADLTNGVVPPDIHPGNTISIGPPLPIGRYFIGLYNPSTVPKSNFISATLGINLAGSQTFNYTATSGGPLADDAVSDGTVAPGLTISIPETVTQLVESVSVGLVVDSPRISDYTFTLISPTGQRVLLMENRGGYTTNGAGEEFIYTNVLNSIATGGAGANTNYLAVGPNPVGTAVPITWNFYTVPDQMTVYDTTNPALFNSGSLIYDSGFTNNPLAGGGGGAQNTVPFTTNIFVPPGFTNITIIMNQFGNPDGGNGDAWTYTAGAANTNYEYLMFTDDTNLANLPIKFAQPPFDFAELSTNFTFSDLDLATNGDYLGPTNIYDAFGGWTVPTNLVTYSTILTNNQLVLVTNVTLLTNNFVSVVSDPSTALTGDTGGSNYLALAYGTITHSIPTTPGRLYNVTFWYRGSGIAGWWRGEGNAADSSDPENDNNNGTLIGRFNFPAGEVSQAFEFEDPGNQFQFAATNTYVQVPASPSLNVGAGGGFTIEGWINPTNLLRPEPIFEWLAHVPTNTAVTNVVIVQGPVLNPANGNYYYLTAATNRATSELWAEELGGHLVTITTANLENWVYDTFTAYGTLNRDLWTGLGYTNGLFGWTSGFTNLTYTNWAPSQPFVCGVNNDEYYVAIMGPTNAYPGLWQLEDNLGLTCDNPPTNPIYGVVEVPMIPTNGVQLWISGTNWTGVTNTLQGCLYANIVDTNYVSHEIFSPTNLLTTNVFQHIALTYNTNSGIAALYLNGTNVATTNLGVFVPKTDGDLLIGWDMSRYTNNYYSGLMDEMSLYGRALSDAEIAGIYNVSASTTNGLIGKFDPTVTPAVGLAEALVAFGSTTNIIFGLNDQWSVDSYTFTATSNSMPLTISGIEPGILLDSFALEEAPETNLYYLPEQELSALNGVPASGPGQTDWTLQVWDNRAGAYLTNGNQVVNWELSFVLVSNAIISATLPPESPVNSTVGAGQTVYYAVPAPVWAHEATNILVSSTEPVSLFYFDPTNAPNGANPPDFQMLGPGVTTGSSVLITNTPTFPLLPTETYYLGVQNLGPRPASVTLEVDFDILGLTNGIPYTSDLTNEYSSVHYFSYDVGSNAFEATFQLLQLNGNADLVLSQGVPLPQLTSSAIGSFSETNATENIYLLTNSTPVALSPGRWYLGVFNRGIDDVAYSVLAKEIDITNSSPTNAYAIINLTNGVPFNWTAGPGAALTNFFLFHATNSVVNGTNVNLQGLRFELYNLSGNGDLTVQTDTPPLAPPFFQSSQNPGFAPELVIVETNSELTNLAADWYLGVPNLETNMISFTIVAETETNSYFPAFPSAAGAGGGAIGAGHAGIISTVYHVTSLDDGSGPGTLRAGVSTTNRTVVFDVAGTIFLQSPLVLTNSYLTIAGQTSPGGITVAGSMTTLQSAHDVIIRDVRFRPGAATGCAADEDVWANGFEGATNTSTPGMGQYFAGGWLVFSGSVDWLDNSTGPAYEGNWYIDLDGSSAGTIQTNIATVAGATYALSFAFCQNPLDTIPPSAEILANGNPLGAVAPTIPNSAANLEWQTTSMVFTATSPSTLLTVQSLDVPSSIGGVFMDAFSLTEIVAPNGASYGSLQFLNASNVVADHISASWSSNALVSVLNSSNVTVEWSIMADSLIPTNGILTNILVAGSLVRQGSGVSSFYHNLYADNYTASLRLGDNVTLDFEDNVIYNWGHRSGLSGGTNDFDLSPNGCTNILNYVCNYLIAGPDTALYASNNFNITNIAFFGGVTNAQAATWIFQTNNFIDSDTNGVLNGSDTGWGMFTNDYTPFAREFTTPFVPVDEAFVGLERTLDFAGVSLSQRDSVDTNIVTRVRYQTGRTVTAAPVVVPNIVAWWKGESNLLDSVGGNNAYAANGIGFAPGEVGTAFNFDGTTEFLIANPASPSSLDVGQGAGLTFEGWINTTTLANSELLFDYEDTIVYEDVPGFYGALSQGISFLIQPTSGGILYANLKDTNTTNHIITSPSGLLTNGVWQHVAVTYDKASGIGALYINGVAVTMTNLGSFTPLTSYTNFCIGGATFGAGDVANPANPFSGDMDELTLYNTALCADTIAAIYDAGHMGKFASGVAGTQPYLDTDQDGIPDFWEDTFTTNLLYVPSNNNDRDGDGYTDLEEYNNWLAAPHALTTVTNPVAVDLYQICGESGHLEFFLTNSVQGFVYLTNVIGSFTNTSPWSNSIAIFTPTNTVGSGTNYFGYASFSFYVTNMDTSGYFGPVPVSVIVSAVPVLTNQPSSITPLIPGVPLDPCNPPGFYTYSVPVTAFDYGMVFQLLTNSGPMALLVGTNPIQSLSSYEYYTNIDNASGNLEIAVLTNSLPVPLTPGTWYVTAVLENGSNQTCYAVEATPLSSIVPPEFFYPTNTTVTNILEFAPWSVGLVATDLDTPPLPLSFTVVSAPAGLSISNDMIYWTPTNAPSTNAVAISVSNGAFSVTNTFSIIVEDSNVPPVLPNIPLQIAFLPGTLVVSNMAINPNGPGTTLGYTVTSTVPDPNQPVIDTNGTITWTPTLAEEYGLYLFTTIVTDTNPAAINVQSLSATNSFYVFVVPPLTVGQPGTNVVAANSTNWFAIRVPNNAILATNTLLFATAPVNLWFSTNVPPSTDQELLSNALHGVSVLSTNLATAPTNIVPGGIYFLGVQNTNSFAVTNALRIDFKLAASPLLSLPVIPDQYIAAGDTLVVTNTATDTNANAVLAYSLINSPPGAVINSNGIITWVTSASMPPTNLVITTIVTDTGANVSEENSFNVIVLPGVGGSGPQTNVVAPNGINWFLVHVPVNADMASNFLLFATAPVDLWFSTNRPPSVTKATDYELLTNSIAGLHVMTTNSAPYLVPGSIYFLGVQNPNSFAVTNAVDVKFHLVPPPMFSFFSIIQTNIAGSNGFLITWFAPTNYQFHLQWTPALQPFHWTNFLGVISDVSSGSPTNGMFQYFDDGSQTGGFGPTRFYRLLFLNSPTNTAPFFLNSPTLFYAPPSVPFVYTNSAKDWDLPPQILSYFVTNTLAGTNVTIAPLTGVITWTPDVSLIGQTNFITTTVFDNGVPSKGATNVFEVIVSTNSAPPSFSSIALVANGVQFQWTAITNEQFQIRWTTNLAPPNWQTFPTIITSPTVNYSFVDTNLPLLMMKFYQLILP